MAVCVGCGLRVVNGIVRTDTDDGWPFPCSQSDNATRVYCSPTTGELLGPPEHDSRLLDSQVTGAPGFGLEVLTPNLQIVAPPCRGLRGFWITEFQLDVESPGLLRFDMRVLINNITVTSVNGFLPGGSLAGDNVRSSMLQHHVFPFTVFPGGSLFLRSGVLVTEQVPEPGNAWTGTTIGTRMLAVTTA